MIPGPVAVVVIAMRSVNCCSNPPLVSIPDISNIFGRRTYDDDGSGGDGGSDGDGDGDGG